MMCKYFSLTIFFIIYQINTIYLSNVEASSTNNATTYSSYSTTKTSKIDFESFDKKKFFKKHYNEVEWDFDFFEIVQSDPDTNPKCEPSGIIDMPKHTAGYIDLVDDVTGGVFGKMFFMYIENRYKNPEVPLLMWSDGGPGGSSISGVFNSRGPYAIQDDYTLCWSKYGWDIYYNMLFIDYPLNVGFSYSIFNLTEYNSKTTPENILQFLYKFYTIHPELVDNELYLTGVSYAGHYLPNIADTIFEANKANKGGNYINLKGMALCNPRVIASFEYLCIPIYALDNDLISKDRAIEILGYWSECDATLKTTCDIYADDFNQRECSNAYLSDCDQMVFAIRDDIPDINIYDIVKRCESIENCNATQYIPGFLNLDAVKEELGITEDIEWMSVNRDILAYLYWENALDPTPWIVDMLEKGLRVLVYSGEYDLFISWIGTEMWLNNTDWEYHDEWLEKPKEDWIVDGVVAGKEKSVNNLKFVIVKDAGHSADRYQPKNILSLILQLTFGENFGTKLFNIRPYD